MMTDKADSLNQQTLARPVRGGVAAYLEKHKYMYLMVVPGLVHLIIFQYIPIYGITMAFQDFSIRRGYFGSDWVGLKHFLWLFQNPNFMRAFRNTWIINTMRIVIGFPAPIILALLLNEVRNMPFKRTIQTISYLPHFISWVVLAGIFNQLLSHDTGAVNHLIAAIGLPRVDFLQSNVFFRPTLVFTNIWKEVGWGTIIYLAAIAAINPELYESAKVDGASRFAMMWFITLPSIASTMIVILILTLGNILTVGFDQVYNLYNPLVYETGDIIQTYIVRSLATAPNFSRLAAAGFVRSIIGMCLLIAANRAVRALGREGIY
jgi:putative aldouronate transport system permease protein